MHTLFEVTTKIALYSHDLQHVMVMEYQPRNVWGLPGGHLELGETPEEALRRELMEELGVEIGEVRRADFFVRGFNEKGGESIVLAFTAVAPKDLATNPSDYYAEHDIWVARDQVNEVNMAETYKEFVLKNWPEAIY